VFVYRVVYIVVVVTVLFVIPTQPGVLSVDNPAVVVLVLFAGTRARTEFNWYVYDARLIKK